MEGDQDDIVGSASVNDDRHDDECDDSAESDEESCDGSSESSSSDDEDDDEDQEEEEEDDDDDDQDEDEDNDDADVDVHGNVSDEEYDQESESDGDEDEDDEDDIEDNEASQRTSLLDDGTNNSTRDETSSHRRSRTWRRLLGWRRSSRKGRNDDDDDGDDEAPREDSALLASCPELGFDHQGNSNNSIRSSRTSKSKRSGSRSGATATTSLPSLEDSDLDEDDDDDENEHGGHNDVPKRRSIEEKVPSRRSLWGKSKSTGRRGFLNFSSRFSDETGERSSLLESSEAINTFSDETAIILDHGSDDDDGESCGSGSSDSSSEPSMPRPTPIDSTISLMNSSAKADMDTSLSRMEGFGNTVPDDMASPRTLRERLSSFRSSRMQKMQIGEQGESSWTLGSAVVDLVGTVLPPTSDHSSSGHDERKTESTTMRFSDRDTGIGSSGGWKINPDRTIESYIQKRGEIGDDEGYMTYLQCELQNRDLEINALQKKVMELQRRLQGAECSDSDEESMANGRVETEGAYTLFDDSDTDDGGDDVARRLLDGEEKTSADGILIDIA
eukprot:CAMPEP_0119561658 /NCGR_PEP_ID=MMETSP1352-20130426/18272_1 /TAXON_ID=265584 /ORGANISM="Stauroneis constricta, Strain CCMP1120" /LENGTH=557 /DNA_ID=CAMNT_0007609905 /DNA_START=162 /DNA_END=1835 /DNA_ORIENTATION=-